MASNLVALNFKIVFEWLKCRRNQNPAAAPSASTGQIDSFNSIRDMQILELEKCIMKLKQDVTEQKTKLEERTTQIFNELRETRAEFKTVNKNILDLSKKISGLESIILDRSKKTRNTG